MRKQTNALVYGGGAFGGILAVLIFEVVLLLIYGKLQIRAHELYFTTPVLAVALVYLWFVPAVTVEEVVDLVSRQRVSDGKPTALVGRLQTLAVLREFITIGGLLTSAMVVVVAVPVMAAVVTARAVLTAWIYDVQEQLEQLR